MKRIQLCVLATALIFGVGCQGVSVSVKDKNGETLLKESMDIYAKMKSFHAKYTWIASYGLGPAVKAEREISFVAPNQYNLNSKIDSGATFVAISSGVDSIGYTTPTSGAVQKAAAASSIAEDKSMMLQHPMFCGTPVLQFFGGSARYGEVVDVSKGAPTVLADEKVLGRPCVPIKYYAKGQNGNTTVWVGKADLLVYQVVYDNAELAKLMSSAEMKKLSGGTAPPKMETRETYSLIEPSAEFKDKTIFEAKVPAGSKVIEVPTQSKQASSPIKEGAVAPNFVVKTLEGKATSLSDFKGKIVLVDFWATWCGPCRESLPITEKLYKQFRDKGLVVMTISDEKKSAVTPFLKENKYTFPCYLDAEGSAFSAYSVESIPTLLIVGRDGKVISCESGFGGEAPIRAALKKAGLSL